MKLSKLIETVKSAERGLIVTRRGREYICETYDVAGWRIVARASSHDLALREGTRAVLAGSDTSEGYWTPAVDALENYSEFYFC